MWVRNFEMRGQTLAPVEDGETVKLLEQTQDGTVIYQTGPKADPITVPQFEFFSQFREATRAELDAMAANDGDPAAAASDAAAAAHAAAQKATAAASEAKTHAGDAKAFATTAGQSASAAAKSAEAAAKPPKAA